MFRIEVPASSANLGPGFDCFGLALKLYLSVIVEPLSNTAQSQISLSGEGAQSLPKDSSNFIFRVALEVARRVGFELPPLNLKIDNQIPLARGMGSSAAAITAGISIVEALSGKEFGEELFFKHALSFEKHADNLAAARLGGFTIVCQTEERIISVKKDWPDQIKAVVVIPAFKLDTEKSRSLLPPNYSRADAVFNIQRVALLQTAVSEKNWRLFEEALKDRIHQPYRSTLVPGLNDALNVKLKGLLGIALSGSGPTLIGLATDNFEVIKSTLREIFARQKIGVRCELLEIENRGRRIEQYGCSKSYF